MDEIKLDGKYRIISKWRKGKEVVILDGAIAPKEHHKHIAKVIMEDPVTNHVRVKCECGKEFNMHTQFLYPVPKKGII